ncbi:MAG TPA: hypothetical protein VFJ02_05225, partial [Vicinamibacterales bacterium]|nr:hypothetical protein [Vicinamibacterales bacterium]
VLRLDPQDAFGTDETVATLSSATRGLSFNITTLYVSTAASGLWAFPGMSLAPQGGPFPSPSAAAAPAGAGQGTTFAIAGPLWFVSGTTVRQSLPPYATSSALVPAGLTTPVGVGVNTCGNLLVGDQTTQTITRYSTAGALLGTYLNFSQINALKKYFPNHFEIDASNRTYVVADSTTSGKNALIVRAGPALDGVDPTSSCASTTQLEILAELSPQAIPGLVSNRAVGIAVGPTNHRITKTFAPNSCGSKLYNFGYHTVKVTFEQCLAPFSLTVSALKSKPSQVIFDQNTTEFPSTPSPMRYSPLGGFAMQYRYDAPLPTPFVDFNTYSAQYGFFTQEIVGTPGVARAPGDNLLDPFTQNVSHDYWDVGALDAAAGDDRSNDFSKRVVFNSGLAASCTFGGFDEPLDTGNPQFNNPQNIKIAFKLTGTGCSGGTLFVSVAKLEGNDFVVQPVSSGQQVDNMMDSSGPGNYHYNLDSSGYVPGIYQITIWGNVVPPINKIVSILN